MSSKFTDIGKEENNEATTDSGFISDYLTSTEITQELASHPEIQSIVEEEEEKENMQLPLDSGVCLSFSELSLEKSDLNNLSKPQIKTTSCTTTSNKENTEIWRKYYEQDKDGDTHLHVTIVCGRKELVEALVKIAPHHRLLDTPNDDAQTPLHLAVETHQHQIVRLLLVAGAKKSPRDIRGNTPLHVACQNGDIDCIKALLDPVQKIERDLLNLSYQPPQIYNDVDLNQWNYVGQTCVHVAASNGHVDVLRHLYWYGANINAREGCSGYTALHFAVENRHEEAVKFLLDECPKLDVNVTTYGGKSALQTTPYISQAMTSMLTVNGVSPYNSEDEYDDESDDDEMLYNPVLPVRNMVGATA
ncbi:unnamed protein product [Brassicogethes aeneus]|uniref:NF-kappa-B inhibitor cactus n=1 Tax=Brassicogethes aeneus TaxID=1431903 RepID=A0A9P0B6J2_BRAAE|nr:unnamed protein product [Brassicogethes aeneus]